MADIKSVIGGKLQDKILGATQDPLKNTPGKSSERTVVTSSGGFGDISAAVTNAYYSLNHRGYGSPIQNNTDNIGYCFFTRPRLNLSYDNIARERIFTIMADATNKTVARAIRAYLDPVGSKAHVEDSFASPLVDSRNPFLVLLTNNLISLSGWPDPYTDVYTSEAGIYKEQWGMIDGISTYHGSYSLSANFRNIVDDPISMMFNIWTQYGSLVYRGDLMPHFDSIFENEIDYETRIYRLVMDVNKQYVQKICACGAAFPVANNLGSQFDYDKEKVFNESIDTISVGWQAFGAIYNDPILIKAFNRTSYIFNPTLSSMTPSKDGSTRTNPFFTKLKPNELNVFNTRPCYPQINPMTMELEWWVDNEVYKQIISAHSSDELPLGFNKVYKDVKDTLGKVNENLPGGLDVGNLAKRL